MAWLRQAKSPTWFQFVQDTLFRNGDWDSNANWWGWWVELLTLLRPLTLLLQEEQIELQSHDESHLALSIRVPYQTY